MAGFSFSAETEGRVAAIEAWNESVTAANTLIVVPTYNERDNIESLLQAVCALPTRVDIIVADDGSPDGTADLVAHLGSTLTAHRIYLMRRKGKYGLGICYLDVFRWILQALPSYKYIVQMDADFSHPPNVIPDLIQAAQAQGVAVGSRYVPGGATPDWNLRRIALSRGGNWYARTVLRLFFPGYPVRDNTAGFIAWRRDVLEHVLRYPIIGDGYAFLTVLKCLAHRLGYTAREVPITFRDRRLGVSKLNKHIILEAVLMPWRLGRTFRQPIS